MQDIFVGRQPIYDRDLNVVAYELLFRSGTENRAGPLDGDQATSQVILNAFVEIGLDRVVGACPAYVNLTRNLLLDDESLPLPPERAVLEVLEDVPVDAALLQALGRLRARGYTIALDDFVLDPGREALLEHARIVKLDLQRLTAPELDAHITALRPYDLTLLAEKVETHAELEQCRALGFEYFQGYFFSRPKIVTGQRIPANRLTILQLLAELQNPHIEVEELEQLIRRDVALSYRLLRYINSAFFALPREVDSIRQAVIYLGLKAIRTWATLIALSGIDDKPHELMTTAMVRAKMCELLAEARKLPVRESCFTAGLFSALDALMDMPMESVVESLPLSAEITGALLGREGTIGRTLTQVLDYEQARWQHMDRADLSAAQLTDIYLQAVEWAQEVTRALGPNR